MRFDWKPESKERYFRKAEAAVKVCSANIMTHADRRAKANEHEICNEK